MKWHAYLYLYFGGVFDGDNFGVILTNFTSSCGTPKNPLDKAILTCNSQHVTNWRNEKNYTKFILK